MAAILIARKHKPSDKLHRTARGSGELVLRVPRTT
jgi:hypothetical protein